MLSSELERWRLIRSRKDGRRSVLGPGGNNCSTGSRESTLLASEPKRARVVRFRNDGRRSGTVRTISNLDDDFGLIFRFDSFVTPPFSSRDSFVAYPFLSHDDLFLLDLDDGISSWEAMASIAGDRERRLGCRG